jgi:serine/threonine-protein kinase PpkA
MRSNRFVFLVVCALSLLPSLVAAQTPSATPPAAPVTPLIMEGKKTLFQRVIARPGATLSPQPSAAGAQPIPGFTVFYVYARQGGDHGWIEVGRTSSGQVDGWMPTDQAIDWKHTMIGAFTNPAGRQRVLFLRTADDEEGVILDADPGHAADTLRAAALAGHPGPVVAMEPANYVDITRNFYLLPILSAQEVEREIGPPMRVLEVLSAPANKPAPPPPSAPKLQDFKAGVVFVLDTTLSMQPYIVATRAAIKDIVARIAASPLRDNFRFGLVAYRDSLAENWRLEYATRVYAKPDFSQPADAINAAIATVHDSSSSSIGFDEDPIAGVKTALDTIDWNALGGRYIILITDSGARTADNPHSITHLGITEIKQLTNAQHVAVFVLHLLTPEGDAAQDHPHAIAQYRELTRFGAAGSLYYGVPHGAPAALAVMVRQLSDELLSQVAAITGRPLNSVEASAPPPDPRMQQQVQVVSDAMRLAYLGDADKTQAPDVVRSFTTDADPANPTVTSLDVKVLLTRNQLSDLAQSLQTILSAGLADRTDPQVFFNQLRAAFATAARDPNQIAHAATLGALLGEYLDGLPYHSEIMDIGQDDWLAMGAIAQRTVLNNIESRLRLYQDYEADPDLWVDLSGTRSPGEAMIPIPIEALP